MAMWTVIIKEPNVSDQTIDDLGITIAQNTQVTLSDQYTFDEITGSDDLRALVLAGDLVVNDGSGDLSAADGVNWLTLDNLKDVRDKHWTKAELAATGGSYDKVDWSQVQNAPTFGAPNWLEPCQYRVLAIQATPPSPTGTGDVYVDTDDQHYYKWNGLSWDDLGAASDGDRVIKLDEADEAIFEFTSPSTWTDLGSNADNDAVIINDDGDGNEAQYIYDLSATTWKKIGDVDFGGHLDGGPGKHDASEVDVEGTYSNIPGTPTDLESAISAIDSELGVATDHNTLDEAYDEGGAGQGRTIDVDAGPVKLDATGANFAPLELTPLTVMPGTGLQDGQLGVKDGILYAYDATRGTWLSVQRIMVAFGRANPSKSQYLQHYSGGHASNLSGLRMARDFTIVSLAGQLETAAPAQVDLRVRKNDVATNIATLTIAAAVSGDEDITVNVDGSAGDYLQAYVNVAGGAANKADAPVLMVEIAWREEPVLVTTTTTTTSSTTTTTTV